MDLRLKRHISILLMLFILTASVMAVIFLSQNVLHISQTIENIEVQEIKTYLTNVSELYVTDLVFNCVSLVVVIIVLLYFLISKNETSLIPFSVIPISFSIEKLVFIFSSINYCLASSKEYDYQYQLSPISVLTIVCLFIIIILSVISIFVGKSDLYDEHFYLFNGAAYLVWALVIIIGLAFSDSNIYSIDFPDFVLVAISIFNYPLALVSGTVILLSLLTYLVFSSYSRGKRHTKTYSTIKSKVKKERSDYDTEMMKINFLKEKGFIDNQQYAKKKEEIEERFNKTSN